MSRMGGLPGGEGGGFEGIDFSKFGAGPGGEPATDLPEDSDEDFEEEEEEKLPGHEEAKEGDAGKAKAVIEEVE